MDIAVIGVIGTLLGAIIGAGSQIIVTARQGKAEDAQKRALQTKKRFEAKRSERKAAYIQFMGAASVWGIALRAQWDCRNGRRKDHPNALIDAEREQREAHWNLVPHLWALRLVGSASVLACGEEVMNALYKMGKEFEQSQDMQDPFPRINEDYWIPARKNFERAAAAELGEQTDFDLQ